MIFACSTCGGLCDAEDDRTNPGRTMFCGQCGHAMIYDGNQVRDLMSYELDNLMNVNVIKNVQAAQQKFCHEKGWWG